MENHIIVKIIFKVTIIIKGNTKHNMIGPQQVDKRFDFSCTSFTEADYCEAEVIK